MAVWDLTLNKLKKRKTEFQSHNSWEGGRLLDINASDADIPIEADEGVLLRADAVGEVDCRAIW